MVCLRIIRRLRWTSLQAGLQIYKIIIIIIKNQRTRHGFLHQKFWGFFFCLLMGLKTYSVILSVGSLNKKRIKLVT